jgi:hypothetical protein
MGMCLFSASYNFGSDIYLTANHMPWIAIESIWFYIKWLAGLLSSSSRPDAGDICPRKNGIKRLKSPLVRIIGLKGQLSLEGRLSQGF